jgi:hypothetical protein
MSFSISSFTEFTPAEFAEFGKVVAEIKPEI